GVRTDGQETYRFFHRSFMEYLAAQQLVRTSSRPEDLAQNLLAQASESRWAEPGKLAIQMIDRNYHFGAATVFDWLLSHCGAGPAAAPGKGPGVSVRPGEEAGQRHGRRAGWPSRATASLPMYRSRSGWPRRRR